MSYTENKTSMTIDDAANLIRNIDGEFPLLEAESLFNFAVRRDHNFSEVVDRRLSHEPLAYIIGHSKFRNLDLVIDERVLIPRTETEPLVEEAIRLAPNSAVVDVGTGSGAIALAIKNERPDLKVMGTDISKDALDVASINSTALGIDVDWHHADLLKGIRPEFDAVLANMPYLPTTKADAYAPEMTEHEPQVALWGGPDGYDLIRRLLSELSSRHRVHTVVLECGLGQETDIHDLVRAAGFTTVYMTKDRKENIRAIVGKR